MKPIKRDILALSPMPSGPASQRCLRCPGPAKQRAFSDLIERMRSRVISRVYDDAERERERLLSVVKNLRSMAKECGPCEVRRYRLLLAEKYEQAASEVES